MMIAGIDVGGTYTDAVLMSGKKIVKRHKVKTNHDDLLSSVREVKAWLEEGQSGLPDKIIVSTTLMTNFITERKYKDTGLLLIPGPGMVYNESMFPFPYKIIRGGVDFQGRIFERLNKKELLSAVQTMTKQGIRLISVNAKFSPRNPALEQEAATIIRDHFPELTVETGLETTGHLNFIRRAISSGLKMASREVYSTFIDSLQEVFAGYPQLYILKSDGGTIPIARAKDYAVETIFSGPAASSFGALALMAEQQSAVVIDIGGTTSDFSLILNGEPLFSTKGIKINDFYTTAKGISVYSLPLGGDTQVNVSAEGFTFAVTRTLPAMFGGSELTVSDCLRFFDTIPIGDKELSANVLQEKAQQLQITPAALASDILHAAAALIANTLQKVIELWEKEPKYRVWQIENQQKIHPDMVYVIGGPAEGLAVFVEKAVSIPVIVDPRASTANALGAALAKDSFDTYVRINTAKNEVSTGFGHFATTTFGKRVHPDSVAEYALGLVHEHLTKEQIQGTPEIFEHEIFSMVSSGYSEGQIHELEIGLHTGLNQDMLPLEGGQ